MTHASFQQQAATVGLIAFGIPTGDLHEGVNHVARVERMVDGVLQLLHLLRVSSPVTLWYVDEKGYLATDIP